MRATIADCIIKVADPAAALAQAGDRPALAWTLRDFCRFGVECFTLLASDAAGFDDLGRFLPTPAQIDVYPPVTEAPQDAPSLPDHFLLCDAGAKLSVNLGRLLQQAAARPDVPVHRLMLRLNGEVTDSTIRLVRRSVDSTGCVDVLCDPADEGDVPRALFLDRDGVLNIDHGFVGSRERFEWTEGALDAIRAASDAGWQVFIVTNQSGVARGLYDERAVRDLLDWIADEARRAGGTVDDARYCPYHPEAKLAAYRETHPWRKPAPGMLLDLMRTWGIEAGSAVMIGDQETDMQAAAAAGVKGHLFPGGNLLDFIRPILLRAA